MWYSFREYQLAEEVPDRDEETRYISARASTPKRQYRRYNFAFPLWRSFWTASIPACATS
jgi:hypothetical protein